MKRTKTQKLIQENEIELKRAIIEQIKDKSAMEIVEMGDGECCMKPKIDKDESSSTEEKETPISKFTKKLYRKALIFFHPDKQEVNDISAYMRTKKAYAINDVLELIFLLSTTANNYSLQINKDEEIIIRDELNKIKREIESMEKSYVYRFKDFNAETQQSIINQLTKANYANHFPGSQ
jgi:hypothetical protein